MYLHIGQDFVINEQDVIGIFDFDNITTSQITMDFLKSLEKEEKLISISDELPKSFIITEASGEYIGYLSPLNSRTIQNRQPNLLFYEKRQNSTNSEQTTPF